MIKLYASNNLEYLVAQLGNQLFKPKHNILSPHTIIVQSLGMQRWISLQLAKQYGVFLNCRFPFPENFAEEIYAAAIPDYQLSPLYTHKALVWLIASLLPKCIDEKPFEEVKQYLVVDGTISQMRLYQLAQKLAFLYDEYIVYFYKDILEWDKKRSDLWQVLLWRYIKNAIAVDTKICHKAQLLEYTIKAVKDPKNAKALKEKLTDEIFVFGITALPEYYIKLLDAISTIVSVHIFQLNPSKEYWFDVSPEKTILRIKQKIKKKNIDTDLHFDVGNPLLASLGKVGQEYISMLLDYNVEEDINNKTHYTFDVHNTLLGHIQSDICHCIERGKGEYAKLAIQPDDRSISIHSCHSPLREVEVLRDYIIDILNSTTIVPNDIVVMAPDIDVYVPFIKAVFDEQVLQKEGLPALPYSIADQSYRNTSRFISAFSDLLEVMTGRLEADKICELLDYDEIALRFGIEKHNVIAFHQWVESLNVKWGKDANHRTHYTHTESDAFTWRYAINRLLMGYAVPQTAGLVDGVIPFDSVEGSGARVLGCCINFLETLLYFFDEAQKPKSLAAWIEYFENLMPAMLDVGSHPQDYENIQSLFSSLGAIVTDITLNEDMEFMVVKSWVENFLSEQRASSNFLSKGITFCQLLPMRSIPFKVVCLLGMNDGQFPRLDENISFDILRYEIYKDKLPPCIRSRRNDDRYLFLESIISAKEFLFISYQGQSPIDLSIKEPSIVVNELLEYIQRGFYVQDQTQSIRDFLVVTHHLYHFHPLYFQGHRNYFSYSKMWYDESRALTGKKRDYRPFVLQPIETKKHNSVITMDEFIEFFNNPARYFITKILGIYLRDSVIDIDSDELLGMGRGLDEYLLNNEIITWRIANRDINDNDIQQFAYIKKKEGSIPDGILGDVIIKKANDEVAFFVDTVKRYCQGEKYIEELVYTSVNNIALYGAPELYNSTQVFYRYAELKPKDSLKAFLWHIFACATVESGVTTFVIARDKDIQYKNISAEDAKKYLEKCMDVFIEGNTRIIPFFPRISHKYYESMKNKGSKYIMYQLEDTFYNDNNSEYSDPYIKRAFYKVNIFNNEVLFEEFASLAHIIFDMIDRCSEKIP